MLTRQATKKLISAFMPKLKKRFELVKWKLDVIVCHESDPRIAKKYNISRRFSKDKVAISIVDKCKIKAKHTQIIIYYDRMDSPRTLLATLIHELIHIVIRSTIRELDNKGPTVGEERLTCLLEKAYMKRIWL